ncbi:MAG: glycosyltransferase family 1 protein [bacterium]
MEKIKIGCYVGKWLGGGVEACMMNYFKYIDKKNFDFYFICDEDSTKIPYDDIKKLGGYVVLVPAYQKIFKFIKEFKKVCKENKFDIVHSNVNLLSVFPLYAAKKSGIKVRVAHSHSTSNKREWKKNIFKNTLKPFSKLYATDYFACSELAGRYQFGNKTFDKGLVTIINNAIEVDKFKFDEKIRKEKRKELNIEDSTLVVGHIGRFVEQKNHSFLIDIFKEVNKDNKDSVLLLAGEGPLQDMIKDKVKNLNLENSVLFLGQRSDARELYQAMDVFVLPSLYEGLPVVGVEAQASGLQCLLSDDMTKETKIVDSTLFLSRKNGVSVWSEKIISLQKLDILKEIDEKYNIKNEIKKIEKKYYIFIDR